VLAREGPKHGLEFTFSKDGSLFTPEYLARFDAIMFYTSGDLLAPGKDGNPPLTPAGKAALLEAIAHARASSASTPPPTPSTPARPPPPIPTSRALGATAAPEPGRP